MEIEDDSEIRHPGRRAPIPAGSDARMVAHLTQIRDRTVAMLGEIDETLEMYNYLLDCYQPKSNEKIGLIWIRTAGRYNRALHPQMVRWLIRHFSGGIRWFYTPLAVAGISRRAKRKGGWALGFEETHAGLKRMAELIERRQKLLAMWANISRSLKDQERLIGEIRIEREAIARKIPQSPFFQQAKLYNKNLRDWPN